MSGVKAWFKKWWKWLLAGLGALFAILTAGIIIHQRRRLGRVKDELVVSEALKEVEKLRAVRAEIVDRVGEKDEAIAVIDEQLAENKRKIIEAHEGGENLSDEEVLEEFAQLGI